MTDKERTEKALKSKAQRAYRTALSVVNSDTNSAANRAYYCLYQAIVAELERPEQIDAGAARAFKDDEKLKFTHSFVRNNARLAGLDGRQSRIVSVAYQFRTEADYSESELFPQDIIDLLNGIAEILECLGVNV